MDDDTFRASFDAPRGQMDCAGCGLTLLVFERDAVPDDVREHIESAEGTITIEHGPREGAAVLLAANGEIFYCPKCGGEYVFTLPR